MQKHDVYNHFTCLTALVILTQCPSPHAGTISCAHTHSACARNHTRIHKLCDGKMDLHDSARLQSQARMNAHTQTHVFRAPRCLKRERFYELHREPSARAFMCACARSKVQLQRGEWSMSTQHLCACVRARQHANVQTFEKCWPSNRKPFPSLAPRHSEHTLETVLQFLFM